jgi:septation ring formation regulator EzrA
MKTAPKKEIKAIDKEDVSKTINTIVSLMESIDSSRELINDKIAYLKNTYGLPSTDVRTAATAIKKQNVEELDEKAKRIQEIIDMCI